MTDVYGVFLPQTVLSEYASAVDVFRIANQFGGEFVWHSVAPLSTAGARDAGGVAAIHSSILPSVLPPGAVVLVFGSLVLPHDMAHPAVLELVEWLRKTVQPDTTVAAVCSGAFVLARAGLLDGREATTHHTLCDVLAQMFPKVKVKPQRAVVMAESSQCSMVWTCAGISSGLDMLLHLLGELAGEPVMTNTMREMVVYFKRSLDDEQITPWLTTRQHTHAGVHRVQDALQKEFAAAHDLTSLAAVGFMSTRNLTRQFKLHTGMSVVQYQQWVRVNVLKQFLQNQSMSVEMAALSAGFGSARQARNVWGKFETGVMSRGRA